MEIYFPVGQGGDASSINQLRYFKMLPRKKQYAVDIEVGNYQQVF